MQIAQDVMCPSKRAASVPLAPPPRLLLPVCPTYVLADGACGAPLHGAQESRPGGGGACMVMEKLYGNDGALKCIMCDGVGGVDKDQIVTRGRQGRCVGSFPGGQLPPGIIL